MRLFKPARALLAAAAAVAALAGCAAPEPKLPTLLVGTASSLEPTLRAFADGFEEDTGVRVALLPAASGTIARQIEEEAPIDVFVSADPAYTERLAAGGFVDPGSVRSFGSGTLVTVASFFASTWAGWADPLTDGRTRFVAIANPRTAPYGAAAVEAMRSAGLWEALEPKVVYGESVAQALQFVRTGNADAGLVAASLVRDGLADRRLAVYDVDPALYEPIAETAGVVSASEHRALAEQFVEALAGWPGA